jgi:hypothetical protein
MVFEECALLLVFLRAISLDEDLESRMSDFRMSDFLPATVWCDFFLLTASEGDTSSYSESLL